MERRKKTDVWAALLFYLNILAGIVLMVILLVFHFAQPEFETLFDRFYQLKLRTNWDIQYLYYLIYMVLVGISITLFGLVLGTFRGRRKNDSKKAFIVTGIISLILLWVSLNVR